MTANQYKKHIQGNQNKMLGEYFENLVDTSCEYYRFSGIADITKTPEPMKPIKNLGKGQFVSVFTKSAQPDYNGVLKGGRAICFDAKFTTQNKISKSVITETQADFLSTKQQLGAICFVLVGFDTFDYFVISWDIWENMENYFKYKHIKHSELMKAKNNCYRVSTKNGGIIDFLTTIKNLNKF